MCFLDCKCVKILEVLGLEASGLELVSHWGENSPLFMSRANTDQSTKKLKNNSSFVTHTLKIFCVRTQVSRICTSIIWKHSGLKITILWVYPGYNLVLHYIIRK